MITERRVSGPSAKDRATATRMKRVALVLLGTMILWILVQDFGSQQGWPPRYALLADLAALAAFVWALVTTWRLWKQRND